MPPTGELATLRTFSTVELAKLGTAQSAGEWDDAKRVDCHLLFPTHHYHGAKREQVDPRRRSISGNLQFPGGEHLRRQRAALDQNQLQV